MHHIAYEVDDLRAELARLEGEGAELIDAEPRTGLFGLQVAFVHPEAVHGVLTELVDTWLSAFASRSASTAASHGCAGRRPRPSTGSRRRSPRATTASFALDAEDGRYTVALRRIVYVKRYAREGARRLRRR